MKNIEMHCHSTNSDWRNSPEEVVWEAKRLWLDFLTLTDHDFISPSDFKDSLRINGIETCDSVEISARNYDVDKSLHLVSYAAILSESLQDILENTRFKKANIYDWQISKLWVFWIKWDVNDFENYMQRKYQRGLKSANKWFLAYYLYSIPWNKEKMKHILWDRFDGDQNLIEVFYLECLKREWSLYEEYWYEIEEYEPSVETTVHEVIHKAGWVVSMAHPNVTFWWNKWWIAEFERTIWSYVDQWINAIEINTKASYEWVQAILKVRREFDLILTFWSDCHQIGYDGRDGKHATIWERNRDMFSLDIWKSFYRWTSITDIEFAKFKDKLWI